MDPLRQFPLGVPSWDSIRQRNLFFVDKTAKIDSLVTNFSRVFISRPRRMGKTFLCCILAELFAHGDSEKFAGTAIHGNWPETECYPVINLSFYGMGKYMGNTDTDVRTFEASLCSMMVAAYESAGFHEASNYKDVKSFVDLAWQLDKLAVGKSLVILIDEWDYPLSSNLDKPQVLGALLRVLNDFYRWLRFQVNARFILITGIMRWHQTSLFTGDDFDDLSMEPWYATLMGYTQEELEGEIFAPYMTSAAHRLGITKNELLEQLKRHYDGFCFDEDAAVKVYCPYSINKFFSKLASKEFLNDPSWVPEFKPFWINSANASASLKSYLRSHAMSKQELIELSRQEFELSHDELQEVSYFQKVTPQQLLVQGGYFSIKAITEETKGKPTYKRCYVCGVTNYEISEKFVEALTDCLVSFPSEKALATALAQVKDALLAGDIAKLYATFNKVLTHGRYDVYSAMEALAAKGAQNKQPDADKEDAPQGQEQTPSQPQEQNLVSAPEPEVFYRTLLMLSLCSFSIDVKDEVANNHGRCDLVAFTNNHTYVFELKRLDKNSNSLQDKIDRIKDAMHQMLDKHYGNNLKEDGKPMTMVVFVICDKSRQICAWCSFKIQDPLVKPIAVDIRGEVIDFESHKTYDLHQGIIESLEPESQEPTPQATKSKRSKAPKATATQAQEPTPQATKSKRSKAPKATAAQAQEPTPQATKSKRSKAPKATAAKAQEPTPQATKSKRSKAPKATTAKAQEPTPQAPKTKRSKAPKATAAKAQEPMPQATKSKRSKAAKASGTGQTS